MSVSVRAAQAADRNTVADMLREFMAYLDAIEPVESPPGLLDYLVDQAFGPAPVCSVLIAEREGAPIGYVSYHPGVWEIYRTVYVISLFVRSEARGSGAGRALMEAVKDAARRQQAKRVVWEVWRKNPPAIDFYRRIGGTVEDENLRMSWVVD